MNKDEAKALLPIIQAFADGRDIEFREKLNGRWLPAPQILINEIWKVEDFRIKPEPVMRPWTERDCPRSFIAKLKTDGPATCRERACRPCPPSSGNVCLLCEQRPLYVNYEDLLSDYVRVLEDGTTVPCGVLVSP